MDNYSHPYKNIPDIKEQTREKYWIKQVRSGNKNVFKKIFEEYYDSLLQFTFRYVHSQPIAEGLVQDVFLWIWENRKSWEVDGKLKTYLFHAAKHQAIDYWRRERTREKYRKQFAHFHESYSPFEDPSDSEDQEFVQAVQELIERLPQRARMVYKLSRIEGLTYNEIADVLDISPKTVETHISRALEFLRTNLSRHVLLLLILIFG